MQDEKEDPFKLDGFERTATAIDKDGNEIEQYMGTVEFIRPFVIVKTIDEDDEERYQIKLGVMILASFFDREVAESAERVLTRAFNLGRIQGLLEGKTGAREVKYSDEPSVFDVDTNSSRN